MALTASYDSDAYDKSWSTVLFSIKRFKSQKIRILKISKKTFKNLMLALLWYLKWITKIRIGPNIIKGFRICKKLDHMKSNYGIKLHWRFFFYLGNVFREEKTGRSVNWFLSVFSPVLVNQLLYKHIVGGQTKFMPLQITAANPC